MACSKCGQAKVAASRLAPQAAKPAPAPNVVTQHQSAAQQAIHKTSVMPKRTSV